MSVTRVPKLRPCPDCGVELQGGKGPHKLAWHGCEPERVELDAEGEGRAMLYALIRKVDLTPDEFRAGLMRAALLRVLEQEDGSLAQIGALFQGLGKYVEAEGGGAAGADELLEKYLGTPSVG